MADDEARPVFGELLKQSQSALAGLQALEEQLSARLADQHAQLNATRSELEQARQEVAALRAGHERLVAEHARAKDEVAHQHQARVELESTVLELRRELEQTLRDRQGVIDARDAERRELEARLAGQQAAVADRVSRVNALEAKTDELAAAQVSWRAERDALLETRDQLAGRVRDLEAGQRQSAAELDRAIHNREQLRAVFEDLKQTHAAAAGQSAEAFKEMARLQDDLRAAAEQAATQERSITRLDEELRQARTLGEEFQAHQLTWAADRQTLLAAAEAADQRRIELEAELAKAQLALAERTTVGQGELAQLRQQAVALQMQLSDEKERLEGALKAATQQASSAAESAAIADKARAEAVAQYGNLVERAQLAAQEWATRRESLTQENEHLAQECASAQQAQMGTAEALRRAQLQLQHLEQSHREKIAGLEERLRGALDAATRPLTPEESHRINTRLNAIVGFASILQDPEANALGPEEQADYLSVINENSRALAGELNLIEVAGMAPAPPTAAGPPVASLGGGQLKPTVLVADPDPAVKERLLPFLTRAGYEVAFAFDTEAAIKQAEALSPLLVLVEATLPPGGAPGLIARLKRDPRTAEIPVVVTTQNLSDPLGVDLGQVDVLTKPIDRQQLLQVMINHDLQADARRAHKMPARVLVIDDDPLSLRLLTAVLKPLQIEVVTAPGGKAGIDLARQCNPELIICDLMMPDLDGFDVIAALRSDPQTSSVPILVYSGKAITEADQQRLQGLIPSIIRKGEFNRERFLEFLLKRGERRARRPGPSIAA